MKRAHVLLIWLALAIVAALAVYGWLHYREADHSAERAGKPAVVDGVVQDGSGKTVRYWYDPMVPGQKFDQPGKSPFMDMQLVPKYADGAGEEAGVSISAQTMQNLGIRLARAAMVDFAGSQRAVGRVEADERRYYAVQTRVPGFVERLLVRAVGDPVTKGQKLAEVYAPELLAAQQEYLALLGLPQAANAEELVEAARTRLQLLGMSRAEIASLQRSRQASTRFGIYAPVSGVVTELAVREGGELMPGASLMQIADLSALWLVAEVPERDIAAIGLGNAALVRLQGMPGEVFHGKVAYVYPMLDDVSRTLKVRIELANRQGRLRPGMYADVDFSLPAQSVLAVPSESVISTGQRKLVIVQQDQSFRPVEIVSGREQGGYTEVIQGLTVGESVVASGQFLIDSEASLSGVLARLAQQPAAADGMAEMQQAAGQDMNHKQHATFSARGRVVSVDSRAGRVTLAHEPIPAIDWPAMTMGFAVSDASQLQALQPGDDVEFELRTETATGDYVIHRIHRPAANRSGMSGGAQ